MTPCLTCAGVGKTYVAGPADTALWPACAACAGTGQAADPARYPLPRLPRSLEGANLGRIVGRFEAIKRGLEIEAESWQEVLLEHGHCWPPAERRCYERTIDRSAEIASNLADALQELYALAETQAEKEAA